MVNKFKVLILLLSVLLITSCEDSEKVVYVTGIEPDTSTTIDTDAVIKDVANFKVGTAIKTSLLDSDDAYKSAVVDNFNQITAEFEMKMEIIWQSSTTYNWDAADELVDFAQTNAMDVHGHTLLWYNSFPNWLQNEANDSIAFEAKIKTYITDVVTRYKDKVKSWDVVNEVISDSGNLREDNVMSPLFNDLIAFYGRCFQYARDADPDALLFYNDYSVVINDEKRNGIKNMMTRFQEDGYPIDGVGDQFHYGKDTGITTIIEGFNDLATTGLLMHISELDIKMNSNQSDLYVFTNTEAETQSDIYEQIVETYNALPENQKFAISVWGVTDKYTWLTTEWHPKEYPLLLDSNFNKKKAYEGFLNGLN